MVALIVLDVIGTQRPPRCEFPQDCFRQTALARLHPARPPTGAVGAPAHRPKQMRPGLEGHRGEDITVREMMFERSPFRSWQRLRRAAMKIPDQVPFTIPGDTIAQ